MRSSIESISTMRLRIASAARAFAVVFVLGVVAFPAAWAQTSADSTLHSFTVLHKFTGTDGYSPNGVFLDAEGILYGTTDYGGKMSDCGGQGCGTVFTLNTSGKEEKILHAFTGGADGGQPSGGGLLYAKGNLYGATYGGSDDGVVFELNLKTHEETVLYTFTGGTDGSEPNGGLILDAKGNLYGVAQQGGNLSDCTGFVHGCGVVFKLNPTTHRETVLYTFTGETDGWDPTTGVVQDAKGNLYGTTNFGGKLSCGGYGTGCGVVFKLTP